MRSVWVQVRCINNAPPMTVRVIYAIINILCLGSLWACWIHQLPGLSAHHGTLMVFMVMSWILYSIICWKEPGYIGYPDPNVHDEHLCRRLVQWKHTLPSQPSNHAHLSDTEIEQDMVSIHANGDISAMFPGEPTPNDPALISKFGDIPWRYCRICRVQQPLRTKHCYVCGQCVLRFGMCIGQNNHLVFWIWLATQSCVCCWAITEIINNIMDLVGVSKNAVGAWILGYSILCLIVLSLVSILVVSVFFYHTKLILNNETTHEAMFRRNDPSTWPWYFRYLVTGSHDPNMRRALKVQTIDGRYQWWARSAFHRGYLRNFLSFTKIGIKTLKYPNRTWCRRYCLTSDVIAAYEQTMRLHGDCRRQLTVIDYTALYHIVEVGSWSVNRQFFQSLSSSMNDYNLTKL